MAISKDAKIGIVVAVVIAVLSASSAPWWWRDIFPSHASPRTAPPTTNAPTSPTPPGPTTPGPTTPAPGSPFWHGQVTLVVNQDYALDGLPVTSLASCAGCMRVGDYPGAGLALQADNGVQPWTKPGEPTYSGCMNLLNSGTTPAAALDVPPYTSGVAVGGWLCAFSKEHDYLRLRFDGSANGGTDYRFTVTAWKGS
jgi:hypothetical protein